MKCLRCQHENPPQSRFCFECGARLAPACSSCGAELPAGVQFCNQCGQATAGQASANPRVMSPESYTPKHLAEKILTSKAALEGERKQVTVLFADLKGSMELLADRDPEEARKLLDPVLERMMEAVHRYEGTVNQVMGDGIMALFGAPLAHEDHAVRACYAALRMQEAVKRYAEEARHAHGVNVQIRVGLNSGEVVVRAIGSDLHMDYTAVGQTTHLAARMEQLARPGSILLTASTLELVEGFVAVKPLGPVPVKGLADPVEVYEVTGAGPARTRLQVAAGRGLTRFVGRDPELEQLRRAQQLAGTGHGQVAAIVGEAGVGKSRLVYELTHSHHLQGWLVLESASVSYGKASSYLPVIDLLKGYFKIQDRDDLREIREKVTGKLLTLDRALESALPALLTLLDVPVDDASWRTLDPAQRRRQTLDAVKRLLLREAREQPLLLIFEDLHWIDGETEALLDGLVESLGSARLMLLVNYRPEYQHVWGGKTYYSQMRLDALPAASAGELLDALLGEDPGLEPLKQLLVKRGNPFFLEETVRTLVETNALTGERGRYRLTQPVQAIQVPATVQAMLAARIDRLAPEDKLLLQTASVVGKDVPFVLLQAIVDLPDEALRRGLDHLQAAEFLYETGLFPDLEYAFAHALTHEVTYGGLLHDRRRKLHARIVGAIEATYEDRLVEHIERLADHAVRGQDWGKAARYLYQAGQKALARSAGHDAVSYLEAALTAVEQRPPEPDLIRIAIDVRLLLRQALRFRGDLERTERYLHEARTLAEQIDDGVRRARSVVGLANLRWNQGDLRAATEHALEARGLGQAADEPGIVAHASVVLMFSWHCRGDYVRAEASGHEVLGLAPRVRQGSYYGHLVPPAIAARASLALTHAERGRFGVAIADGEAALRLAEELSQPFTMGIAAWGLGYVHRLRGNVEDARVLLQRGLDIANEWKLEWWLANLGWLLGHVEALSGRSEGLVRLRDALDRFEVRGFGAHRSLVIVDLGEAYLESGDVRAAQDAGRNALMRARQFGERGVEAWALRLLGGCASLGGDASESNVFYQDAQALATELGMGPLAAHCHLGLGKLCVRTNKRDQAHEHLTIATTMYREMDMPFWLERAAAEWTELGA